MNIELKKNLYNFFSFYQVIKILKKYTNINKMILDFF